MPTRPRSRTALDHRATSRTPIDSGTGTLTVAEEDYSPRADAAGQPGPAQGSTRRLCDARPVADGRQPRGGGRAPAAGARNRACPVDPGNRRRRRGARTSGRRPKPACSCATTSAVRLGHPALQTGRALADAQVRSIVNLVASSVPGMKPEFGDHRRPDGRRCSTSPAPVAKARHRATTTHRRCSARSRTSIANSCPSC